MDKNGHITTKELGACFESLGENVAGYKLREMIDVIDRDGNGTIEFDEFLEVIVIIIMHLVIYRCITLRWKFLNFP